MKRKYIHHHADIYWNIVVHSITEKDWGKHIGDVHVTIKSNCPTYKGKITFAAPKASVVSFLFWVEAHPIHQLPLIVRSMLQGHHVDGGWEKRIARGKEIYEAMTKQHKHMEIA